MKINSLAAPWGISLKLRKDPAIFGAWLDVWGRWCQENDHQKISNQEKLFEEFVIAAQETCKEHDDA